jgi:hypothetical protein
MLTTTKYGFSVGERVISKVILFDENEFLINVGEELKIVAIAPKVRKTNPWAIKNAPDYSDNKDYFVNLVQANQENDYGRRIRCNFICIKKS